MVVIFMYGKDRPEVFPVCEQYATIFLSVLTSASDGSVSSQIYAPVTFTPLILKNNWYAMNIWFN